MSETWVDPSTGLEWQVEPPRCDMAWAAAKKYANSLKLAGGGWHLPTKEELLTISGRNRHEALKGDGWFWSSSPVEDDDDCAWGVYFLYGSFSYFGVHYDLHIRCVRESK